MSYQPRLKLGRLVVQICLKVLTGSLELGLVGLEVFFPPFYKFSFHTKITNNRVHSRE